MLGADGRRHTANIPVGGCGLPPRSPKARDRGHPFLVVGWGAGRDNRRSYDSAEKCFAQDDADRVAYRAASSGTATAYGGRTPYSAAMRKKPRIPSTHSSSST